MRLEIPYDKIFSTSDFNLDNNGLAIVDYIELLGTPENRTLRTYERIEEVYRMLENIGRISNYNENRFTME
jgi:hypothetical protein